MHVPDLGRIGLWSRELRYAAPETAGDAAAELDGLGIRTLWIPGGLGGDVFGAVLRTLRAAPRCVVATGILNIWAHEPAEVAAGSRAMEDEFAGRFLLGLGVGHARSVEGTIGKEWRQPLARMRSFLDDLDRMAPGPRVLAALGPRMLELARDRSAGAHPYLVSPDHTRRARGILGSRAILAPEQKVVLESDRSRALAVAREALAPYLQLTNYTRNLERLGFTEDDMLGGGSERLVDALFAMGDERSAIDRVGEHLDAGADHVCVHLVSPRTASSDDVSAPPLEGWKRLVPALLEIGEG